MSASPFGMSTGDEWGKAALRKIFISHSSLDKPFVRRRIDEPLRNAGYGTWLDEKELNIGDPLARKISEALRQARVVIVVVSEASVKSNWLRYELSAATDRMVKQELRLIPVLIDDVEVPSEVAGLLYADMRKGTRNGIGRVLSTLEFEASRYPRPPDPASLTSPSAYQRGRAYDKVLAEEADGGLFSASMDLSATRSVDWEGLTIGGIDARVDTVHCYIQERVLRSEDLDGWELQLEETSEDFGLLIFEGPLGDDVKAALEQASDGVWYRVITAGPRRSVGRVIVEVGVTLPEATIEARLRAGVRVLGRIIRKGEPSLLEQVLPQPPDE